MDSQAFNPHANMATFGSTKAAQVAIVDASGAQITSFGAASAAVGSTGSAVPSSADYAGLNVGGTLRGATGVNPSGSIYAQQVDVASFAGTTAVIGSGTATGALRVELPTNGTGVIATVSAVTAITNALPAGTNAIGKLAANSGVDIGDVDILSIAAGDNNIGNVDLASSIPAGTNNIGDVDVLTIAAGDNNIGNVDIVTVPTDPFGANADAASATGSISAKLRFIASTGIPITGTVTVGSHAVTNAGTFAVQDSAAEASLSVMDDWDNAASDGASVSGDVAHDSGDAGEPVKIGGKALTAQPTAVTANDRVNGMFDVYGRMITMNGLREMKGAQITTITSSTSETTCVTADATYKLDVYGVLITNSSATATEVSFKDSTSGTTRFWVSVPANDMRGFVLPMDAGHLQAAANNNWTATCADSVASIIITMLFVKNL